MLAVGNNELDNAIDYDFIICPHCGENHPLEYGKNADTGEISEMLQFYTCTQSNESYLYSLNGHVLPVRKAS